VRPTIVGAWLVAASLLFWIAWVLMPGVGVTDAQQILTLVSQQRPEVRLSAILQLISAACYAPALVGVAELGQKWNRSAIGVGAILLLIGAMGSAADAMLHLLAYEMTAPNTTPSQLIPVMARMQGPDLVLLAPMLVSYFAGSVVLAIGFARAGATSMWNPTLFIVALAVALVGSRLFGAEPGGQRIVGLAILGLISFSQAWLGIALWKSPGERRDFDHRPSVG
jgi:hypothetical protein